MTDNISRQAAIDALCNRCDRVNYVPCTEECNDIKILRKLPSTDRKGHWKIYNHVDQMGNPIGMKILVCDQCKENKTLSWRAKVPNYCPHCGADMRGEDDAG